MVTDHPEDSTQIQPGHYVSRHTYYLSRIFGRQRAT